MMSLLSVSPIPPPSYSKDLWLTFFLICFAALIVGLKIFDVIDYKLKKKKNGNNENLSERVEECGQEL